MKSLFWQTFAALFLLGAVALHAQVPQLINYQGRVIVGAANFNGPGQFRFALVDATGATTFWSNDGTSVAGSQPAAAVTLTVSNGLLLGDTTVANMSAIPASVFTNPDVRLRVWFNNGIVGPQLLTPDQRIAAVGYALMAANVPPAAITSAQLAPAAVTSANLAAGAAAANLVTSGQSGVGSGGVVLSPTENSNLAAAGYIRLGGSLTITPESAQAAPTTIPQGAAPTPPSGPAPTFSSGAATSRATASATIPSPIFGYRSPPSASPLRARTTPPYGPARA